MSEHSSKDDTTPFTRIGGEPGLRALIDDFVDRVFNDLMIGFLFQRANRERIKRYEYEFAAAFLGADVQYAGKPIDAAHKPHRIMGGQFARRRKILDDVLKAHDVPDDVRSLWLAHTDALRPLVTHDAGASCTDPSLLKRPGRG